MTNDEDDVYDILVMGNAYTPHYGNDETTLFTHEEMNANFTKQLENLPVFIEHDTKFQIGNVVDSFVNENRQIKTLLHIHGNKMVNQILPGTLYKDPENNSRGYYNSLSLGNDIGLVREGDRVTVKENVPSEISICMNGDRPKTEIDDYWLIPRGKDVKEFIRETVEPKIQRF